MRQYGVQSERTVLQLCIEVVYKNLSCFQHSLIMAIPIENIWQTLARAIRVIVSHVARVPYFPRIDAAAFIYFVVQFGAATIRGWYLFEGGIYYFGQYDCAAYTASLASSPSKCVDKLVKNYGSYKTRSRNTQNNNSQWERFGKCRPQCHPKH